MRMGRDSPVRPVIRPEQCQALGKTLSLADLNEAAVAADAFACVR
jgi:hypothetical protein